MKILRSMTGVCLLAALQPLAATAGAAQPLDAVRAAVARFLEAQVERGDASVVVEVGRIDTRLRLAPCDRELTPFSPPGFRRVGNVTVGVRCEGAKPWTLYVTARVMLMRPVVVLRRSVTRNHELSADDLHLQTRDVSRLSGAYLTSMDSIIGMRTRAPMRTGFVLTENLLALPKLVRRGDRVTVLAGENGFEVRTAGRALQDGATGQSIRVKNLRSKRIVEGVVSGRGEVRVQM